MKPLRSSRRENLGGIGGETRDMSRTVFAISCALRCLFFLSRGGCEADGVTEARDDQQAYHQLQ